MRPRFVLITLAVGLLLPSVLLPPVATAARQSSSVTPSAAEFGSPTMSCDEFRRNCCPTERIAEIDVDWGDIEDCWKEQIREGLA